MYKFHNFFTLNIVRFRQDLFTDHADYDLFRIKNMKMDFLYIVTAKIYSICRKKMSNPPHLGLIFLWSPFQNLKIVIGVKLGVFSHWLKGTASLFEFNFAILYQHVIVFN